MEKVESIIKYIDPYKIIADLNKKNKTLEKRLLYFETDSRMKFKEEKIHRMYVYNSKNKTKFKFLSEFIEKMYKAGNSTSQIAEILGVEKAAIGYNLKTIGVKLRTRGGSRNKLILSSDTISKIRSSTDTQRVIAKEYGISNTTISAIKNKFGKWAEL